MDIFLKYNNGFKWVEYNGMWIKGNMNEGLERKKLVKSSIVKTLIKNTQFFSFVLETEDFVYAAVDHLRMYPLFYSIKNGQSFLSDDAKWIRDKAQDNEMNIQSSAEFLMTGYVTGNDTLYKEVKQLQAGEYLIYNKLDKSLEVAQYYKYYSNQKAHYNKLELIEELDQIHLEVFKRLIRSLNGRTAVLPLSGGYDSRIIAMMLKRLGYEDVICFTYGKPGNWEAKVSKEIAEDLNYKWLFVPYTKNKWKQWFHSKQREEYFDFSNGLSSLPHIQDCLAVGELKKKGLIPEDSVIIPGHTAMLSFSGYDQNSNNMDEVVSALFKKHYSLWNWSYKNISEFKEQLKDKVYYNVSMAENGTSIENLFYQWELRERHAKFICNSVRAYELFGFEWRMPLWEKELVDFWLNTPVDYKMGKYLYKEYFNRKFSSSKNSISQPNSQTNKKGSNPFKRLVMKTHLIYDILTKIKRITTYYKHPLVWYHIIGYKRYLIGVLKGANNINSYLADIYINVIKKY